MSYFHRITQLIVITLFFIAMSACATSPAILKESSPIAKIGKKKDKLISTFTKSPLDLNSTVEFANSKIKKIHTSKIESFCSNPAQKFNLKLLKIFDSYNVDNLLKGSFRNHTHLDVVPLSKSKESRAKLNDSNLNSLLKPSRKTFLINGECPNFVKGFGSQDLILSTQIVTDCGNLNPEFERNKYQVNMFACLGSQNRIVFLGKDSIDDETVSDNLLNANRKSFTLKNKKLNKRLKESFNRIVKGFEEHRNQ